MSSETNIFVDHQRQNTNHLHSCSNLSLTVIIYEKTRHMGYLMKIVITMYILLYKNSYPCSKFETISSVSEIQCSPLIATNSILVYPSYRLKLCGLAVACSVHSTDVHAEIGLEWPGKSILVSLTKIIARHRVQGIDTI